MESSTLCPPAGENTSLESMTEKCAIGASICRLHLQVEQSQATRSPPAPASCSCAVFPCTPTSFPTTRTVCPWNWPDCSCCELRRGVCGIAVSILLARASGAACARRGLG
eukprot:3855804-Pleurochrysis_carterae.AAC.3